MKVKVNEGVLKILSGEFLYHVWAVHSWWTYEEGGLLTFTLYKRELMAWKAPFFNESIRMNRVPYAWSDNMAKLHTSENKMPVYKPARGVVLFKDVPEETKL